MHFGSLFVTFFCALLFGILRGDEAGTVSLILCVPVTLICTIVGLIKSEGKTKLLVIPAQAIIWLVCALMGGNIFKLLLGALILVVGGFLAVQFIMPMFSSGKKEEKAAEEPGEAPFASWIPETLQDNDGHEWVRDYTSDNVLRYHCAATGESTEFYDHGNDNREWKYASQTITDSNGREFHWH